MSKPEKAIVVATPALKMRPMNKADWETIFTLLENGTPMEAILAGYPIKIHTLKTRIARDRPLLWSKMKSLPTSKQVEVDATARAENIIKATGRILKVDLAEIIGHDVGVLAADARNQQQEKAADPNKVLTPVGLKHARSLHALAKTAALIPGIGLDNGGGGGGGVNVNVAVNHATVMRRGGNDSLLADDTDFIDAVVTEQTEGETE